MVGDKVGENEAIAHFLETVALYIPVNWIIFININTTRGHSSGDYQVPGAGAKLLDTTD